MQTGVSSRLESLCYLSSYIRSLGLSDASIGRICSYHWCWTMICSRYKRGAQHPSTLYCISSTITLVADVEQLLEGNNYLKCRQKSMRCSIELMVLCGLGPQLLPAAWGSQVVTLRQRLKCGIWVLDWINWSASKEGKCFSDARLKIDSPLDELERLPLSSSWAIPLTLTKTLPRWYEMYVRTCKDEYS